MKSSDIKNLRKAMGEDFKNLKVVVIKTDLCARKSKMVSGWLVEVNGEVLSSFRNDVRVFGSLDTVSDELEKLGLNQFSVSNSVKEGV